MTNEELERLINWADGWAADLETVNPGAFSNAPNFRATAQALRSLLQLREAAKKLETRLRRNASWLRGGDPMETQMAEADVYEHCANCVAALLSVVPSVPKEEK